MTANWAERLPCQRVTGAQWCSLCVSVRPGVDSGCIVGLIGARGGGERWLRGARLAEPWPPSPHNSHLRELSAASECMCCFFIYKPFMQHKSRLPPSPIGHSGLFLISVLAWICCHVAHIPLSAVQRTTCGTGSGTTTTTIDTTIAF